MQIIQFQEYIIRARWIELASNKLRKMQIQWFQKMQIYKIENFKIGDVMLVQFFPTPPRFF